MLRRTELGKAIIAARKLEEHDLCNLEDEAVDGGDIINPSTGNCVSKNSQTGKSIIANINYKPIIFPKWLEDDKDEDEEDEDEDEDEDENENGY